MGLVGQTWGAVAEEDEDEVLTTQIRSRKEGEAADG